MGAEEAVIRQSPSCTGNATSLSASSFCFPERQGLLPFPLKKSLHHPQNEGISFTIKFYELKAIS